MKGYWHNPAETERVFDESWFRTGDLGFVDADGYLAITDRKHDMIVSGGENIYPKEVEHAFAQDSRILEVSVFGLPDPHWIEKVAAAVVLHPDTTATVEELSQRLRSLLASYKCPKVIYLCDSLPKNAAGKVQKSELKQRFAGP
jgi:fatty-acyl-CoA synthase